MSKDIAHKWEHVVKQFVKNYSGRRFLWDAESYPWIRSASVFTLARTSPRNSVAAYSHDWQANQLKQFAASRGVNVKLHVDEIGVSGHRLTLLSRWGFMHLVETARQAKTPILAVDLSRFIRDPKLLPKLAALGVDLVTLHSPWRQPDTLHSWRVAGAIGERERQKALGGDNRDLGRFLSLNFEYVTN